MWNLEQRSGSFLARRTVTSFAFSPTAGRTPLSGERTPATDVVARTATLVPSREHACGTFFRA